MGLASRSGFKLTADEYVSGNSCLSRAASNPSNPTFTAITRFSVWFTRCTLTLPCPLPSGLAYTPVRVAGHAGFRKVVFSTFLSKSEFFEYAGKDSQSNTGRRVMNFMGAILDSRIRFANWLFALSTNPANALGRQLKMCTAWHAGVWQHRAANSPSGTFNISP